jgi:hypothetical protein
MHQNVPRSIILSDDASSFCIFGTFCVVFLSLMEVEGILEEITVISSTKGRNDMY